MKAVRLVSLPGGKQRAIPCLVALQVTGYSVFEFYARNLLGVAQQSLLASAADQIPRQRVVN